MPARFSPLCHYLNSLRLNDAYKVISNIIGSDDGLSSGRRQAIIRTNAGILLIGPLGTNSSEILIGIQSFSSNKIRLKMSSAKCCPFRLGLNVLSVLTAASCQNRIAWWRYNNNNNVVFIKRWFQDGTNITYGYLTLAHKRWSEYTRGIRAKGKSTYPKIHNMK